jgi:hypothetical protein
MSHVADVILLTFVEDAGIDDAQKWLRDNKWPELVEVSGNAGGNKAMQCDVWVAAINCFAIDDFAKAVKAINWEWPDSVQLLVKDEHDDHFTLRSGVSANN